MPEKNHTPRNPAFRELIADKLQRQFFMRHIGFELTGIEPGKMKGRLPDKDFLRQQDYFIHGGVVSTICDIVTGLAAYSLVEPEQKVVTAEIKVSYYRPAVGEELIAHGWVEKAGSRFHFCEAEVWAVKDGKQQRVAKATTTMAVIVPGKKEPTADHAG